MAKSTMALGQYRGKLGGMVFRKGDNGQQIISAYQPVVKNPRSDAQMLQRAKFNLAVQFASQVPLSFIYSLGSSSRSRRGALVRSVVLAATASKSGANFVANVNGAAIVLSNGPSASMMAPAAFFDSGSGDLTVTWTDISGSAGWNTTDKVSILIGVFSVDGSMTPVLLPLADIAEIGTHQASYYIPESLHGSNNKAMVWVFATRQGQSVNSASGSDVSVPAQSLSASLALGTGLSSLEYSDSMFAGVFPLE